MDGKKPPVPSSRAAHGQALKNALAAAVAGAQQRRADAGIQVHGAVPGLYVQFESQPGVSLKLSSLEDARQGIELVAVIHSQTEEAEPRRIERATVFVPEGKVKHFIARFENYSKTTPKTKGERRYEDMLDPVATLRLATLRGLWTDAPEVYPASDETIWWEVWLRRHDGRELARLMEFALVQRIEVGARRLQFDDRIVTLVRATPDQLAASIDVLDDVAEVRRAKETAAFFVDDMEPEEQGEWVTDLLTRTTGPAHDAPAVCVLDTGVTLGHPLLEASLASTDCHACDPTWGTHDHDGHGTEMAGLALYGDLTPVLTGSDPVRLRHGLESVKILPPHGTNPPELYGAIIAEATSRVEIQATERRRCFSLAIASTDERDRGQPTSWSAAIDALAAGLAFDVSSQGLVYFDGSEPVQRLFVVSAGNVEPGALQVAHLDRSDADAVHDPAHAWNALTVGAFTEKVLIQDQAWSGWEPVAPAGELSPWSTTGVVFANAWPLKPDVVFEGGNVVKNSKGDLDFPCPDVSLLSTYHQPAQKPLVLSWATSAATAQVARMAAIISAEYPALWPEAVRALIVHSAEWTRPMQAHLKGAGGKRARARLVRRYGFGVPRMDRALRSAGDSLTLIAQDSIRPFADGKMREMHLFHLPWPTDVLQGLGGTPVRLRVTLSYFIEPNPGRRGWKHRHRYASHGLRFDVKGPVESVEEFRKRLNQYALDEEEEKPRTGGASSEWYLGAQAREHGSIHSDFLQGFAADIAERGVIGVFPVGGWWKDQPKRDRSEQGARYALVVSIETPGVETDIWTPVAQQVGVAIDIET